MGHHRDGFPIRTPKDLLAGVEVGRWSAQKSLQCPLAAVCTHRLGCRSASHHLRHTCLRPGGWPCRLFASLCLHQRCGFVLQGAGYIYRPSKVLLRLRNNQAGSLTVVIRPASRAGTAALNTALSPHREASLLDHRLEGPKKAGMSPPGMRGAAWRPPPASSPRWARIHAPKDVPKLES